MDSAKSRRLSRRNFLKQTSGAILLSPSTILGSASAQPRPKPNIILILTDDQGWWDLGVNGNSIIETPNVDRLAREGVRFTHFYVSPVCTPTRASLLTGRHYQRTGAIDSALDREPMRSDEVTLGQVFQRNGYRTALIGKWHVGRYMKYHPNNRGFDEFFGFWQYGFINHYFDSEELFHNKEHVKTSGYITDILTDQALAFVKEGPGRRPFLLYLAYNAPHVPHLVPDSYIQKYLDKKVPFSAARIYGMVSSLDENIARLLKTVDEARLREQTIVIFMSDNGGISRYFRAGLRGGKGSVYEGGVRVPFIARWPGQFPEGVVVDAEAQHIDVLPTLCELAGIPAPGQAKLDGRSIASLLRHGAGDSPHRYMFHQWHREYGPRTGPDRRAILDVQTGLKLVNRHPEDLSLDIDEPKSQSSNSSVHYELFDIRKDPEESRDISAEYPDVVTKLRKQYEQWYADVSTGRYKSSVPIEAGRADENPVELSLLWGYPVGKKLHFTYRHYLGDTFENWSELTDYVTWKIEVTQSGRYEVILEYACVPENAGSKLVIKAGQTEVEHVVQPTAGSGVFRRVNAGVLSLAKEQVSFEIRPVSIVGRELLILHGVCLKHLGNAQGRER